MTEGERRIWNAQRWAYVAARPLTLTVGVWAVLSSVAALVTIAFNGPLQNTSALATLFPTWAEVVWVGTYLFGSVCLVGGITRLSLRVEVAGCLAVAGVQFVNVYAVTVVRGPAAGFVSGVGFAVACGLLVRVGVLLRGSP